MHGGQLHLIRKPKARCGDDCRCALLLRRCVGFWPSARTRRQRNDIAASAFTLCFLVAVTTSASSARSPIDQRTSSANTIEFSSNPLRRNPKHPSPCSRESQQQSRPRPVGRLQPLPGRLLPRPSAQQYLPHPYRDGGSITKKISCPRAQSNGRVFVAVRSLSVRDLSLRYRTPRKTDFIIVCDRSTNILSTARPLQPPTKRRLHVQDRYRRWHRTCRCPSMWRCHEASDPCRPKQQHHQRRQVQDFRLWKCNCKLKLPH